MFEKNLARLEDLLHLGGCVALIAVAVFINADILLRLFFDTPLQVQFELTELYLMPALATLSLARVYREGGHLALHLVPAKLPRLLTLIIDKLRRLLPAAFFTAVTWMSGKFALQAFSQGKVEYGVIDWQVGWAYASIPLGCGVLVLRLMTDAFAKGTSGNN